MSVLASGYATVDFDPRKIPKEGATVWETMRALVPERALTAGKGWWYSDGSAFRGFNFVTPQAIVDANRALFKARAPVTEDADAALDAVLCRGSLHPPRWLGTNFFPLCTRNPRVLVASNSPPVPLPHCFPLRAEPGEAVEPSKATASEPLRAKPGETAEPSKATAAEPLRAEPFERLERVRRGDGDVAGNSE